MCYKVIPDKKRFLIFINMYIKMIQILSLFLGSLKIRICILKKCLLFLCLKKILAL